MGRWWRLSSAIVVNSATGSRGTYFAGMSPKGLWQARLETERVCVCALVLGGEGKAFAGDPSLSLVSAGSWKAGRIRMSDGFCFVFGCGLVVPSIGRNGGYS